MRKIFKGRKNKLKRKVFFIGIIVLLVIMIGIGCFLFYYDKEIPYQKEVTIQVGETLPSIGDYFDKKDISKLDSELIQWSKMDLEDNRIYQVGTYTGFVIYHKKELELSLIVVDNEEPEIENVHDIEIIEGEEINLLEGIVVNDNSHETIQAVVYGEYDFNTVGSYSLSYVAEDSSGNRTKKDFILTVKEKEMFPAIAYSSGTKVGTTSKGYSIEEIDGGTYIQGILVVNKTYSLPSSYGANGLKKEVLDAFSMMQKDASILGLSLQITSGYRSFYTQKSIYQNYVLMDGEKNADTYSARPGHSEHQTGLAFDLNSITMDFIYTDEGKWVSENCYQYGFIIRYPKGKESITGYMYEPWHLRYVGSNLARILYNEGAWITLEEYFGITSQYVN